jgi:hypothetical protein
MSNSTGAETMRQLTVYGKPLHFHGSFPSVVSGPSSVPSRAARSRHGVLLWYGAHGRNVSLTCRHFALSRRRCTARSR